MKLYNIFLLFCFATILTSCGISEPQMHYSAPFICVVNSDGTGFKKLLNLNEISLPFDTNRLFDLLVTKDEKLIFAADKYYITDPDTIAPVPLIGFRPNIGVGMTLTSSNKAYFCSNGDLYKHDILTHTTVNLTEDINEYVGNPIISLDDNIITMYSVDQDSLIKHYLCYYKLDSDSLFLLPQAGNSIENGIYSSLDNRLYYEQHDGLYRIDLNGNNKQQLFQYSGDAYQSFGLNSKGDHIITKNGQQVLNLYNIMNDSIDYTQQLDYMSILYKITRNANKVFYAFGGYIYVLDLDTHSTFQITDNNAGVEKVMCPSWDGTKIYFIANVRVSK